MQNRDLNKMFVSVITGGAGFLGSHLADYLLKKGHRVIVLDNLVTGRIENIAHLAGNEMFKFIKQDVTQYLYVSEKVDYVWHFASPASPIDYAEIPIQTLKVGSLGTHNALGLALKNKARFLLTSTSEVYGDPLQHPQREDYWGNVNTVGPRGCYDEAKRFAEAITMAYHRAHGLETRIVRIFNTYGPRMRMKDGRVVPAFVSQALRGEPITIYGQGTQTRSFCYCSDLIEGIYRLMMSEEIYPVNIGREIIALTGAKSQLIHMELPIDDPKQRRPDISRAKHLLNWEPQISLREGLEKTIQWFAEEIQKN